VNVFDDPGETFSLLTPFRPLPTRGLGYSDNVLDLLGGSGIGSAVTVLYIFLCVWKVGGGAQLFGHCVTPTITVTRTVIGKGGLRPSRARVGYG